MLHSAIGAGTDALSVKKEKEGEGPRRSAVAEACRGKRLLTEVKGRGLDREPTV